MNKIYHRAALINSNGGVSALCFSRPRVIALGKALWTNRDEAVTCPKCLALIQARASTDAAHEVMSDIEYGRRAYRDNKPRGDMKNESQRIGWDEAAHNSREGNSQ